MPSGVSGAGAALGFSAESGLQTRGPGIITAPVPCARSSSPDPRADPALRHLRRSPVGFPLRVSLERLCRPGASNTGPPHPFAREVASPAWISATGSSTDAGGSQCRVGHAGVDPLHGKRQDGHFSSRSGAHITQSLTPGLSLRTAAYQRQDRISQKRHANPKLEQIH